MGYINLNPKPDAASVTRAYLKAGKPFTMPIFSGPDTFPLALTCHSFAEIKIEIKTPIKTKGWDVDAILTFLGGQRGYT